MSSPTRPLSPSGTVKKTDTVGTMEDPAKSVPGIMDEVTRVVDHKAERRLCRKFDYRLLPILAVMCELTPSVVLNMLTLIDLFNALDKGNLGNAETDGMTDGK